MKTELRPKHLSKIGNNYILWFEASNQYIVISSTIKDILDVYLKVNNQDEFIQELHTACNVDNSNSRLLYKEISELLINANSTSSNFYTQELKSPSIPELSIERTYMFGSKTILINYGSKQIEDLIHPQWTHSSINHCDSFSSNFHVFKNNDLFFLLKDKEYIGQYALADTHLLQGQFAVELINILYDQKESDWIATFHASTVCNDQEAIMIIGDSGNGKSTLAAVLMAHGIDVLADDFTPLSAINGHIYRFPSGISVKEGAFEILENMYPGFEEFPIYSSTSKRVKIKYIPPIKKIETSISNFPCNKIVYVKYDADEKSNLHKVGIEQILPVLINESWLSPLVKNSQLFLDWLKDVQCYELNYSDNNFAISQFKKLFNTQSP